MENLEVKARPLTEWSFAYRLALATEGKEPKNEEVPEGWVDRILKAEHSPIRAKMYLVEIRNCPTWVSVHLVRHKVGVEWYVRSRRDDRNDNPVPRAEMPQGAPVSLTMVANAQALISISRKRLCRKASPETREVWEAVRVAIRGIDPAMAAVMVPECSYRGLCPEMRPCFKSR